MRNGLVKFLQAVFEKFNLIVYTSTDEEISTLILDHLEKLCGLPGRLFSLRLYSRDCHKGTMDFEHLKMRDLQLITDSEVPSR